MRPDNIRRPGLVAEALARHGDKATVYGSEDRPILASENAAGLTRAEWKVCFQVSQGLTAKAAADEIGVTVNTVRTHLRNIYVKTNLRSYYHLARRLGSPVEQQALYQRRLELSA